MPCRAAVNPQNAKRVSFVDDDWDPVDRGRNAGGDELHSTRQDSAFCFAATGPGAYGMPGTDAYGYIFEDANGDAAPAGWFGVDESAQTGAFWHLEDAQINEDRGTEAVLDIPQNDGQENNYALWCGRQNVCGWRDPDGYGNGWDQWVVVDLLPADEWILYDFYFVGDFEGGSNDYFQFLVGDGAGGFTVIEENRVPRERTVQQYTGVIPVAFERAVFRFVSDLGMSDEDGWYNSDLGACWLDNISLLGTLPYVNTDFENGVVPAGMTFETPPGAGDFAALYSNLYQQDPIYNNSSQVWAFFDQDTGNPQYPIPVVAYGPPYVDNSIQSPLLDMMHDSDGNGVPLALGSATRVLLETMVYFDNPLNPLVFFTWSVAAQTAGSPCLGQYWGDSAAWYSDAKQWRTRKHDATMQILRSARGGAVTGISVKLNVVDMYELWGGIFGDGNNHTPAPYLDVVRVILFDKSGFGWDEKPDEQAQDNFEKDRQPYVRIDSAANIEELDDPVVLVGDSLVISLELDSNGGIRTVPPGPQNPTSENRPALYLWWRVIVGPHVDSNDPIMGDPDGTDGIWSPWVGTADWYGETWNYMIGDSALFRSKVAEGDYAFDFNDAFFEGGDVIQYFYRAEAVNGQTETLPEKALWGAEELREYFTIRCLPTDGMILLFVEDDAGTLTEWREGLAYNGYTDYDVYSTRNPSAGQHNGLAGRAALNNLSQYQVIIMDCGDLPNFTVSSQQPYDKTSDAELLDAFLSTLNRDAYLWLMGDQVANELTNGSIFLTQNLGANLLSGSEYYDDWNGIYVPKVYATHPLLFYLGGEPYFWVDGGGPTVENFSLIESNDALAEECHAWEVFSATEVAGIFNLDPDGDGTPVGPGGYTNRVLFNPFSYYHCWDAGYGIPADESYVRLMIRHVLENMFGAYATEPPNDLPEKPLVTRLDGSYPNPFNPCVKISFSLASEEFVNLSIYDVTGRRIKTLIDGRLEANFYEQVWDGTDGAGTRVASGVYLYKLFAGEYSDGGKLVMLK